MRLILILICFSLFGVFANAANESEPQNNSGLCKDDLDIEQLDLPTPLKLNRESVAYLLQNSEHRWLIESLSRIFTKIHAAGGDLSDLLKTVSEASVSDSANLDLSAHPLYRSRPDLLSPVVKENYAQLLDSPWRSELEPDDLAVLAFLLSDVRKNSPDAEFVANIGINFGNKAQYQRVSQMLRSEPHRLAAAVLLRSGEGQSFFLNAWNAIASARGKPSKANEKFLRPLTSADLDEMASRLERGEVDLGVAGVVQHYIDLMVMSMSQYGLERHARNPHERKTQEETHLRQDSLLLVSQFFAEKIQVRASIDNLMEIVDYIWFGTPLPVSFERFYGDIIKNAKTLAVPLRASYQSRPLAATPIAPIRFNLVDQFEPRQSVYVRRNRLEPEVTVTEKLTTLESQIPPELALRAFTSYDKRPRALRDLEAGITYQFWFMRDDAPRLQQVRLSEAAVEWIKENPIAGRDMLDALHMGRARIKYQSGYKRLARRSANIDGAVYEIKIWSSDRGVMYLHKGVWRFVTVVDKAKLDATVDGLERPREN